MQLGTDAHTMFADLLPEALGIFRWATVALLFCCGTARHLPATVKFLLRLWSWMLICRVHGVVFCPVRLSFLGCMIACLLVCLLQYACARACLSVCLFLFAVLPMVFYCLCS